MVDLQPTLLSYFLQELISHAALFVGLIVAFFTFLGFAFPQGPKSERKAPELPTLLGLDVLISSTFYVAGKLFLYGQYVAWTIAQAPDPSTTSLSAYFTAIRGFTDTTWLGHLASNFEQLFGLGTVDSLFIGGVVSQILVKGYTPTGKDRGFSKWGATVWVGAAVVLLIMNYERVDLVRNPLPHEWFVLILAAIFGGLIPWIVELAQILGRRLSKSEPNRV